ncbi:hypothetical protein [Nannocystis punicea]|uniref:BRCT domain-containing protein n=1 Tax=Nannocystis punicea TaxID=2995304 RepID=A0ABY7GW06_9BACT|nr:hypothetical protein [Nannocystis poenicansa]WAS91137.1 hypothetical protein O0S08_33540 [Nannocystis poenicansa]
MSTQVPPKPTSIDSPPDEGLAAFVGKRVYVAGDFDVLPCGLLKEQLRMIGSRIETHLSRKTNLLIHGANAEAELERARPLGVRTMTEVPVLLALRAAGELPDRLLAALGVRGPLPFDKEIPPPPRVQTLNPEPDDIMRASEAIRAAQLDRYGLTIAQLLRCWCRAFAERPDIRVLHATADRPASPATLAALAPRLPAHALALAAELGSLHFRWVFKGERDEAGSDLGHNGGRINFVGFDALRWCAEDESYDAKFDELQAEGSTFLRHELEASPADARLWFIHTSAEPRALGTVESYLAHGAGRAFVWYWQRRGDSETDALVARLTAASLPSATPADEVVAGLCARSLAPAEAQALQRWLGPDAVLLLPA